MISNIECLVTACKELNISYSFLDKNQNCVAVGTEPFSFFINASNPLNDESVAVLIKDKEFAYNALKDIVRMPETRALNILHRTMIKKLLLIYIKRY